MEEQEEGRNEERERGTMSVVTDEVSLPSKRWRSASVSCASDGSLATTGHKVWPAAFALAEFLLASQRGFSSFLASKPSMRVLELGAGTGWLGLTLALNVPNIHELMLTERDEGIRFLSSNVLAFQSSTRHSCQHISTRALDWTHGCEGEIVGTQWDLVIGSDLLYEEEGVRALVRCWKELLEADTCGNISILYCHTFGRFETIDELLDEELSTQALIAKDIPRKDDEYEDEDCRYKEDAPPAYSELFPEMRQSVLSISLSKTSSSSSLCVRGGD